MDIAGYLPLRDGAVCQVSKLYRLRSRRRVTNTSSEPNALVLSVYIWTRKLNRYSFGGPLSRGAGSMLRSGMPLTVDGECVRWLGANFWSSTGGPLMWRTYDPA